MPKPLLPHASVFGGVANFFTPSWEPPETEKMAIFQGHHGGRFTGKTEFLPASF